MKFLTWKPLVVVAGLAALYAAPAAATPYYLFDGDSQRAVEIDGGVVVNAFSTFGLGYPVAITNSIWLGERDNQGAVQYNLNGTATGVTAAGGDYISQLLDGTTDGTHNYGVTCCAGQNVVTIANGDWTGQQALFNIGDDASGITYNSASNSLYVTNYSGQLVNYSMTGEVLGTFNSPSNTFLAALAYEASSNTLWAWDRNSSSLDQLSLTGALLQSQHVDVGAFGVSNPFGGEMAIGAGGVPEASTWALMLVGFGGLGAMLRRRRTAIAA